MATRKHALFKVTIPTWVHAKASCFVYETAEEGIDMGVEIDGYGALFLSRRAIKEAAEVAGFSVNEEGAALEEENAWLQHELAETQSEAKALREELDTIGKTIARSVGVDK